MPAHRTPITAPRISALTPAMRIVRRHRAVALAAAGVLVAAALPAGAQAWTTPEPLSTSSVRESLVSTADGSGRVLTSFRERSSGDVVMNTRSADGAWRAAPVLASDPGANYSEGADAATLGDGTALTLFTETHPAGELLMLRLGAPGDAAGATVQVASSENGFIDPHLTVFGTTGWYVTWVEDAGRTFDLKVAQGSGSGVPTVASAVAGSTDRIYRAAPASDSVGNPTVAYIMQLGGANYGAFAVRRSGSVWQTPVQLSAVTDNVGDVVAAPDGTGDIHVAWSAEDQTDTTNRVRTRRYDSATLGWTFPAINADIGTASLTGTMALVENSRGVVHGANLVVAKGATVSAYYYSADSQTWSSPPQVIDASAASVRAVTIGANGGGGAAVAWIDTDGLHAAQRVGALWGSPSLVQATTPNALGSPWVAMTPEGIPTVSWTRVDGGFDNTAFASTDLARPDAPTGVVATAEDASLTAQWTAPVSTGGAAIASYVATAYPGGASCTTTATTCTIGGLTNGVRYTVAVVASNGGLTSFNSALSGAVTPQAAVAPGAPAGGGAQPGQATPAGTGTAAGPGAVAPDAVAAATASAAIRVTRRSIVVSTRVRAAAGGTVSQVVVARNARRKVVARCKVKRKRVPGASHVVRCTMGSKARRALAGGRLALRVTTTVARADGVVSTHRQTKAVRRR